ncbi:unnamed protein product, partial [Vitis vinifera]|uniref:Uncharacterized protein n=1 Tax=Vitis vinifera TaxID=29760 RepID=D7TGS4_VITVI
MRKLCFESALKRFEEDRCLDGMEGRITNSYKEGCKY